MARKAGEFRPTKTTDKLHRLIDEIDEPNVAKKLGYKNASSIEKGIKEKGIKETGKKVKLLSQDSAYLRKVEMTLMKIKAWAKKYKKEGYGIKVDRIESTLISQMDRAFEDILNQWDDLDGYSLIKKLSNRERDLLKKYRLISGTEADHPMAISTATMTKNLSLKKRFEVMENLAARGGYSGIGPNKLIYLSKASHIGSQFVEPGQIMSHMDPHLTEVGQRAKLNTKMWSSKVSPSIGTNPSDVGKSKKELLARRKALDLKKRPLLVQQNTPFNRNITVEKAGRQLYERFFLPQEMLAKQASLRPSELKAKDYYRKLFGRNPFAHKYGSKQWAKNKKLMDLLPFTFSDVVNAIDKGEDIPKLDDDALAVFNAVKGQKHIPGKVLDGLKTAFANPTVKRAARWGGFGLAGVGILGDTLDVFAAPQAITGKTAAQRFEGGARGISGTLGWASVATKNPTLGLYSGAVSGGLMLGDALVENRKARDKEKNKRLDILAKGPTNVQANTESGVAEIKQWDQTRWEKAIGIFQRSQRRWNNFIDR